MKVKVLLTLMKISMSIIENSQFFQERMFVESIRNSSGKLIMIQVPVFQRYGVDAGSLTIDTNMHC